MNSPEITEQEFETIERYLKNNMSAEEQERFQQQLIEEPTLQQKVNEVRMLIDGVEAASLKEKLNTYHEEVSATHSKVIDPPKLISTPEKNYTRWYAAAGILVALIGIFWFLNRTSPTEQLFAQHFEPDPGLPTTMSTSGNYAFFEGMVDYKQGKYDEALSKWEPLLEASPENDTLQYFLGMAHLAKDESKEALPYLEKVAAMTSSSFLSEANWYLGLSYLDLNQPKKATRVLKRSDVPASQEIVTALTSK
ncbi:tetratricopeptide repeat protein [Altibacter sp. HG106]|uniref:tetratricopeptide repeat protein n=1 Tax=Altibacter sp. HG106 TaxID=3023937 RepID=UPI0023504AEF|nr:tetratricopeptide repeat protein [Altibacter sp. HG106]MDC7994209.1 tetratricopeptide repeat protein [Altibacter sp. HG106]